MSEPSRKANPNAAITVDPPRPVRVLMSWFMNRMIDPKRAKKARDAHEAKRQATGAPHQVEYFHQLDDPYSHLSAQKLNELALAYDIEIIPHLIHPTGGKEQPYPDELATYARRDAAAVAPHYGLSFPGNAGMTPSDADRELAARILVAANRPQFVERIAAISDALWSGDRPTLEKLAQEFGTVDKAKADRQLNEGTKRLKDLKHYSGATFFYAGEWFWGVDRLGHLENRLRERGAGRSATPHAVAPRPPIDRGEQRDSGTMTLEIFPSLRSPYTAIIFDKACALADQAGVNLAIRPVLPMVMRGVPATRNKGVYIFTDAKREADALGVAFDKIYDPIGEPVRRAYSLYPWAAEQGKGQAFLSAFLQAAFVKGTRTDTDRGLRKVVEQAGLSWTEARQHLGSEAWIAEIEANQQAMTQELGLWGVPSFRLTGPGREPAFSAWGQDRLWLVASEIKRRLAVSQTSSP